jgi:YqaJ-like viral recombinase domain
MIRIDCEQGSIDWIEARLGIPTASRFDEIITPKTMKMSASCEKYACELIAEKILGYPMDQASSSFMVRGSVLEKKAVDFYELRRDCDTEKVGVILRDDRRVGCSPDRLVGVDGLLEIKCPNAANHIGYLLDADGIGYRAQVQGQLWVTGRSWVDTLSYNPELPPALVRVQRDEEFIGKLAQAVDHFLSFVDESMLKLARAGHIPPIEAPALRIA